MESKHSRSHKTVAQKIIIANYSIQNSINKGAEKFGVERKSIRKWIQQLPELTQVSVIVDTWNENKFLFSFYFLLLPVLIIPLEKENRQK